MKDKRNASGHFQGCCGCLREQPDFPVAGVKAQCDRGAIGGANSTLCAEYEKLWAEHF